MPGTMCSRAAGQAWARYQAMWGGHYVEAAVNQHRRNMSDAGDVVEQLVLTAPRRVTPVVGNQACEAHSEIGVSVDQPWTPRP